MNAKEDLNWTNQLQKGNAWVSGDKIQIISSILIQECMVFVFAQMSTSVLREPMTKVAMNASTSLGVTLVYVMKATC